jgi:hypothetical protein
MVAEWLLEPGKPDDKFTWVYRLSGEDRVYISGTAGRIRVGDARFMADAMNEYSLCTGESR